MKKYLLKLWQDDEAKGEVFKNIGLGLFVNGAYGLSDLKVEFFNITDLIIGIFVMISGIIIERRNKWDIG
jgi:hypothetical protein